MLKGAQCAIDMFFYLATPYTNYPYGRQAAYRTACRLAARLTRAGISVYTPIGTMHPVAIAGDLSPVDHDLWMRIDAPFVAAAGGLIVAMMEGWELSRGVTHEIEQFRLTPKPIIYWNTDDPLPRF